MEANTVCLVVKKGMRERETPFHREGQHGVVCAGLEAEVTLPPGDRTRGGNLWKTQAPVHAVFCSGFSVLPH